MQRKQFKNVSNLVVQDQKLINYCLERCIKDDDYKPWPLSQSRLRNLLGCSIHKYKRYIQKQLKPEWSWKNYGSLWNVDHIKPLDFPGRNVYNYARRFHYKNCRPLLVTENSSKKNH